MKARINPGRGVKGKRSEVAAAYGLTVEEFSRHDCDFLQSEGFDDDGNEYDTLHDWLVSDKKPHIDNTPWQKGDDLPE